MNGVELMQHLDNDVHIRKFLPIIRDSPRYPVIYDSNRVVLSLPPIINGDKSKITLNTENVFIEVTGTDLTKASITLNTVLAMFSEYCGDKFSVEPVEVVDSAGKSTIFPDIATRNVETSVEFINKSLGANVAPSEMIDLLQKMSVKASLQENKTIKVEVPITRSDILHACDVMEDVAIAIGYDNLKIEFPGTSTHGKQQPINKVTDLLRHEIAMSGYSEVLTMALCSREENYKLLGRPDDNLAVTLANPKTIEFQIARTTLLVGLLKTIATNRKNPLPLKIFEISDIVVKDNMTDVGASNHRRLCAVYCANSSGFEIIHSLLDQVMLLNRIEWKEQGKPTRSKNFYYLKPSEDPTFFPGARADVMLNDVKIGVMGIVHPNVLANFEIPFPCSAVEIDIEPFV